MVRILAQIMNQNTASTDVVGMEILNLEVENLNRLRQLLTTDGIDKCIFAVLELQLVVQLQILELTINALCCVAFYREILTRVALDYIVASACELC